MKYRTDLAVEGVNYASDSNGIKQVKRGKEFKITEITIENDNHINTIGKGKGVYITLENEKLGSFSDSYKEMALELADELKMLIPEGEALVVGLGNEEITPDALGPQTAHKVLATRHLQDELSEGEDDFLTSLRRVSVFAGGVLGQTGIETAEIVRAISKQINPSVIIAVDALACSEISRLGTTIQISDSGISPGSGVANTRKELSQRVFGIPVIAVGVPTVVDMHTIVESLTGSKPERNMPNMMVTPRDIDRLTERTAQLIAFAINLALQPTMTFEDIRGLF